MIIVLETQNLPEFWKVVTGESPTTTANNRIVELSAATTV